MTAHYLLIKIKMAKYSYDKKGDLVLDKKTLFKRPKGVDFTTKKNSEMKDGVVKKGVAPKNKKATIEKTK